MLFVSRFGLKQYEAVFVKEERINGIGITYYENIDKKY